MEKYLLEICADSLESVLAAERGGADRIELCSNLVIGGTTPSESLFLEIKKHTAIKLHILIRPRFGDFCYSDYEFAVMKEEICHFKKLGADGVVIGILKKDGSLDTERMKELVALAEGMSITMHRAFDVCRDPYEALEQAIGLGINTILTSGQKNACIEGIDVLKQLRKRADGRIALLAGAGVGSDSIREIYEKTGLTQYHMSGKIIKDSAMEYRKQDVNMGIPSLSEFEIYQTDEKEVARARSVIDSLAREAKG